MLDKDLAVMSTYGGRVSSDLRPPFNEGLAAMATCVAYVINYLVSFYESCVDFCSPCQIFMVYMSSL